MGPEATPELGRSEATAQEARRAANRRKVREHRQRLRGQGMRPIQIWVPDVTSPEFAAEVWRQSLLANASPEEARIQSLIDSVHEWPDDDALGCPSRLGGQSISERYQDDSANSYKEKDPARKSCSASFPSSEPAAVAPKPSR